MRWAVVMLVFTGCYQPGSFPGGDAPVPDDDALLVERCVGDTVGFIGPTCFTNPVSDLPPLIDIDTDGSCDVSDTTDPRFCYMAAERVVIDRSIAVRGSRPLVLWAATTIQIGETGVLDVASRLADAKPAAGANHESCAGVIDGIADDNLKVGNGGCGGAFGTDAGIGGRGAAQAMAVDGALCTTEPVMTIEDLRGGCRGGNGGFAMNGGHSGGAVYLLAGEKIEVHGVINASGAGAASAMASGQTLPGGGGGGSGGMIAFDAPKLDLEGALLLALGGGGGSGSGEASGAQNGNPGDEADPVTGATAAGSSQTVNINFGGGSSLSNPSGGGNVAIDKHGGGGGGGGGHGVLRIFPPTLIPTGTFVAKPDLPPPPI